MERYRRYIQRLREEESEELFKNSDSDHAVIVLSELFQSAKEEVWILTQTMSDDIYQAEECLDSLEKFLNKENVKLRIILAEFDEKKWTSSGISKTLSSYNNGEEKKVEVYKTKLDISFSGGDGNRKSINFAVADCRSYRFELDIKARVAIGSFNGEDQAERLVDLFNKIIENKEDTEEIRLNTSN